jgi:hypothetical protein
VDADCPGIDNIIKKVKHMGALENYGIGSTNERRVSSAFKRVKSVRDKFLNRKKLTEKEKTILILIDGWGLYGAAKEAVKRGIL